MKVGLPRALHFYSYGVLWYTFLEKLGAQVVLSSLTDKQTLDQGSKKMVDEACLPLKLMRGHVEDLKEKGVDYIFLPRVVKITGSTFNCPKSAGLPELIFQTGRDLPPLLSPTIEGDVADARPYYETGRRLDASRKRVEQAFQAAYNRWLVCQQEDQRAKPVKTIGLLGHSYLTEDRFINFHIKEKLEERGYRVVVSRRHRFLAADRQDAIYPQYMFWQSGQDMAAILDEGGRADGYIFLSAFGCGPDSYIELYCRKYLQAIGVPYLALSLDEQTGEAGFDTRIEAFLDVMERQERRQGA